MHESIGDHVYITLDLQAQLIWKSDLSLLKILYLVVRYSAFIDVLFNVFGGSKPKVLILIRSHCTGAGYLAPALTSSVCPR